MQSASNKAGHETHPGRLKAAHRKILTNSILVTGLLCSAAGLLTFASGILQTTFDVFVVVGLSLLFLAMYPLARFAGFGLYFPVFYMLYTYAVLLAQHAVLTKYGVSASIFAVSWSIGITFMFARTGMLISLAGVVFLYFGMPSVNLLFQPEVYSHYNAAYYLEGAYAVFVTLLACAFVDVFRQQLMNATSSLNAALHKAEAGELAKSEFLANMSHEIRTPMNGVIGMAELLAKTELAPKQKMFTEVIVKSGYSLLTIINDILDFSKLDAGQMHLDPAPFRLREAVEDVATLVSAKVREKDLEMMVRVNPQVPDVLVGDVGRFRQIITNLVGNAVKFTEQGHVYVNVDAVKTPEDDEGIVRLRVAVKDTGIGIPAEKAGRVFEKFSQVDGSATRKHEGTGLGLSICSHLVDLMDGEIGVDSTVDTGSTFWFEIPLPVYVNQEPAVKTTADVSGCRVLIVDDNEVNRSILKEQLESWMFDSAAVTNGAEAIAFLKHAHSEHYRIDAVIMDYHMPGMNGGEVVAALRANPDLWSLPVIMLTSVDQTEDGRTFFSLDIQGHLSKPARSAMLHEMLVDVLQGSPSGIAGRKAAETLQRINGEENLVA